MAHPGIRFVLATFFLFLMALIGVEGRQFAPLGAPEARAQATEAFTQVTPAKVYSGIPSHAGIADANPTLGTNGYCVEVRNENHAPVGPNSGFTVVAGTLLTADTFLNGSATTTDDVYCAVVQATPNTTTLPRPQMVVRWTYLDGGVTVIAELKIDVVTVILKGTNGVVGGAAQVCTEGWDATFLTGAASNTPPAAPNQKDVVDTDDWSEIPGAPTVTELGTLRAGPEQCINLSTTIVNGVLDIDVTLNFYAIYDPNTAADDVLIPVSKADVVDLVKATFPELRHISRPVKPDLGGQIVKERRANPNVIGSTHIACVVPSVPQDTLLPQDVAFVSETGATVSGLQVFTNTGVFPDPEGVPVGTKCIRWTSLTAGNQTVSLTMTLSIQNPANGTGGPKVVFVGWDTDLDGNETQSFGGPLIKEWDTIEKTVINQSGHWYDSDLTNTTVEQAIQFNVADGKWLAGTGIQFKEWAVSHVVGYDGKILPLDGVPLTLRITSDCGYFANDPNNPNTSLKVIDGPEAITLDGSFDFLVDIFRDTGCHPGAVIDIEIQARYPATIGNPPAVALERIAILLTYLQPETVPIILWAGQTATLGYGFVGDCTQGAFPVKFTREEGQPGSFLSSGSDEVESNLDPQSCATTVQYESEDPGEVHISAVLANQPFAKTVYTIFYLAFESVTLSTPKDTLTVSERSELAGETRGWFLANNRSNRPREVKNGQVLPEGRWVLPDDWQLLKGPDDFRRTWPSQASLPPVRVTYYMENEGRRNDYKATIRDGSAGFFLPHDNSEYFFNIHPDTFVPSVNGRLEKPRILSQDIDLNGITIVDFIGDRNLSFEGCAKNVPTGNPHCKKGDVAGRGRYFAVADYEFGPNNARGVPFVHRGKWPPMRSNTIEITYTWEGYKTVTWVPGEDPQYKYVVAHIKDRDGFCDALSYNNTLGIPVDFKIDADSDGIIVEVGTQPSEIVAELKREARGTSFDTRDDNGEPMNVSIARTVVEDDECQVWIKISNSLQVKPVNVLVTFPEPPQAMPGDVRISNAVCVPNGTVRVTNYGDNPVPLQGFALRSARGSQPKDPEEHLGLYGWLKPGESREFTSDFTKEPWQFGGEWILGNVGGDYVRLVWEETTISKLYCDPATKPSPFINPPLVKVPGGFWPDPVYVQGVFTFSATATVDRNVPTLGLPPTKPYELDGEGTLILDIIVPFGDEQPLLLNAGWNLVSAGNGTMPIERAVGANMSKLIAIYEWNAETETWAHFIVGAPDSLNTIDSLKDGKIYWVQTKEPFTLVLPK